MAAANVGARMAAMFPDAGTIEAARAAVIGIVGDNVLTTNETRTESFFMGLPDVENVVTVLQGNATAVAKKNIAAEWQTKCLRLMAPRVLSYYMLSKKFVYTCCSEIMKADYDDIVRLARVSNTPDCSVENLRTYKNSVDRFRLRLADILLPDEFVTPGTSIAGDYAIEQGNLQGIAEVLQEIKTQRRLQINQTIVRKDRLALPSHATSYEGFFDGFMELATNKMNKVNRAGKRLIATALVAYLQSRGQTLEAYERTHVDVTNKITNWNAVRVQVVDIMANANAAPQQNDGEAYAQQIANIDTLFLTYLWFRIMGIIEMDGNVPTEAGFAGLLRMNATLYGIGTRVTGTNVIIRDYFTGVAGPMTVLSGLMNTTGSIHQPPYAMNYHRLSHMVATFGGLYLPNIEKSIYTMGVSTLYITSLRLESGAGARFIIAWNRIQKIIAPYYPNANAAIQANASALHALHQLFLRKPTCMAQSLGLQGRLDQVNLVASIGENRMIQLSMPDIVVFSPRPDVRRAAGVNLNEAAILARRQQIRNILAGRHADQDQENEEENDGEN